MKAVLTSKMSEICTKFKLPARFGIPGPNIWLEMDEYTKYNPINLGVGFADFAPPKHVTEGLAGVARSDNLLLHQYTKGFGHPRLVNILSKLYSKLINREINPDTEMLISQGAQQALYNIFNGMLDDDDEVIVIEPFFEPYEPMIRETGAKPIFIPLRHNGSNTGGALTTNDFLLDKKELESKFNSKTKAILLNTPNNPLGKVFNMEEMQMIADLCKNGPTLPIADEVYEWLVYKPYQHIRMATLPGMWERTITVGSAGKTFNITGWRTGWAYGPAGLMNNLKVVHQNCIYTHLTPIQEAIAMAFEKEFDLMINNPKQCFFYTLSEELFTKREFLMKAFADAGVNPIQPQGGYMIIADFRNQSTNIDLSKETGNYKDIRLTKWLARNGLMGFPASAFYSTENKLVAENLIRFCFIKRDEKLCAAARVLHDLFSKIQ
ncbi:kynurenine aminotransferase-like [Atheta coriaria]|uniref:kynurenine aminotransferase-like n=1 Tax=Dalotia coriaria TaxID=877792 RepID=UPI0031F4248D